MSQEKYTISQCYHVLSVDQKTFRRWLRQAEITPTINKVDNRVKYLTAAQVQELASLHGRTPQPIEQDREKQPPRAYQRLADRVNILEQEIATTRKAMSTLQREVQRVKITLADQQYQHQIRQASPTAPGPEDQAQASDLVPLSTFADLHAISRNDADRRWRSGFITVVKQSQTGKRQPLIVVGAKGKRDFWVQYHATVGFQSCDGCPHAPEQ